MNTINNKSKRDSRLRMIKALLELIQSRRLQDISITRLCQAADINRTTFYNHYNNINELAEDARNSITHEFAQQFSGNLDGFTPANLMIMFSHLKENHILYKTYFQLNPSYVELLGFYNAEEAKKHYPGQNDKMIRYHAEFFAAGMTAIIKRWLLNGCPESPSEMVKIVVSEYGTKS